MKTIVINLFGVPGAGKSTGAAYIFAMLKMNGVNAELVTEFAKDKVWEENSEVFKNQSYIFGKQSFKMSRCRDKVEVIVTDSPLPLSIFYNGDMSLTENFDRSVMDVFNSYENRNYLLLRVKPYNASGRLQTEEESNALARPLMQMLDDYEIKYQAVGGHLTGYDLIVENTLTEIQKRKELQNVIHYTENI